MDTFLPSGHQTSLQAFSNINTQSQEQILRYGKIRRLDRHQPIFKQGEAAEHFYLVTCGLVKLTRLTEDQQSHLLDLIAPGESIGLVLMQEKLQIYPISAECLSPTETVMLHRDFFFKIWKESPNLFQYGSKQIHKRLEHFQNGLCMHNRTLTERLAHLLTEKIYPLKNTVYLTRRDLAECLGSSTESVIRILSLWTQQKIISTINHQIIIHDLERLQKVWKK